MIEEEDFIQENFRLIAEDNREDPRYEFAEYNYDGEEIDDAEPSGSDC